MAVSESKCQIAFHLPPNILNLNLGLPKPSTTRRKEPKSPRNTEKQQNRSENAETHAKTPKMSKNVPEKP